MRSALFLALLLSLHLPAAAQNDSTDIWKRVSVTAYSGLRVPYGTGYVRLFDADGETLLSATERRGGGALLGVDAEMQLTGPLHLMVGGVYSRTGISEFYLEREAGFRDTADFRVRYADQMLFAKLGASVRLQTPPAAGETRAGPATSFFGAAALVRQLNSNHPALNLGFKGAFPTSRDGVEFILGLEDYWVFWNQSGLTPVLSSVLHPRQEPVGVEFLYDTSHVLLLRAGLSLRF